MKANKYRSEKAKGRRLEQKLASMIRTKGLDDDAKAMPMSGAMDGFKSDIFTRLPFAFECKNNENHNVWKEFSQAEEARRPFKAPVLVISGNFRPMLAVVDVNDFLELLKEVQDLRNSLGVK